VAPSTLPPTRTRRLWFRGTTVCPDDCDTRGDVSVDELLTVVNIALGNAAVSTCAAGDANGDQRITINEIPTAVNRVAKAACACNASSSH